jgi:alpha-soluble NSF attachment protein
MNAANCYRKNQPEKALKMMIEASKIFSHMGKFTQAAKVEKDLGELFEKEEKYIDAFKHYKIAAEFYENENQKATANGFFIKCADMLAFLKKYGDATDYYEKSARQALEEKVTSYGAKEIFFKAFLCRLANCKSYDENKVEELKDFLKDYFGDDPKFEGSPEGDLCEGILDSIVKDDVKEFQKHLRGYHSIKKLDEWKSVKYIFLKF